MNAAENDDTGRSFRALLERAIRGEQEAAWELLEHYGSHVLHLLVIKRREQGELPFDAARLVAHVWELLRNEPLGADRARAATDGPTSGIGPADGDGPIDPNPPTFGMHSADYPTLGEHSTGADSQSPAEQIESARRRWQHLTVGPIEHKKILKLRLQGASFEEIAEELGLAEPVVRRVIHQLAREGQGNP